MPWLTPQDKAQPPRDSSAGPRICVERVGRLGPGEALGELGGFGERGDELVVCPIQRKLLCVCVCVCVCVCTHVCTPVGTVILSWIQAS